MAFFGCAYALRLSLVAVLLAGFSNACLGDNISKDSNKQLVLNYYDDIIFNGRVEKIDDYIGDTYIQHNPQTPNGKQAVVDFVKAFVLPTADENGYIKPSGRIVRAVAEGDLVAVHVKSDSWLGPRGSVIVDIYRIADGKLVEHWDVIQEIPEKSVNGNTMF